MAKSRKQWIKLHLNGNTVAALILYSVIMMALGAGIKSCCDRAHEKQEYASNMRRANTR